MSNNVLNDLAIPMGLGLLRLSTQDRPEKAEAIRVIHHALDRGIRLLDAAEIVFCPHKAFPVGCFCRKPFPGIGVHLMRKHELALEHLIMVGDMESDERFAESIGAKFEHANEFFGD